MARDPTAAAATGGVRIGRQQIIVVVLLIAAIALSGCASGEPSITGSQADSVSHQPDPRSHQAAEGTHQAASANHRANASHQSVVPPREVGQEFAMFYAKLAADQDEPASRAEVQALARQLAPTRSPPTDGQYPCVVHLPGRVPPTQNCVAVVTSCGSVTGRCSVGAAPAPVDATGYVDCASLGRVVSVDDPSNDVKQVVPLIRSDRLIAATDPRADLVEVRVAAGPTRFCADFRTLAPLGPGTWLGLNINQNGTPDRQFAPTINDRSSTPELQSPIDTPIAGQIGTTGDWTSLVIDANNPSAPFRTSRSNSAPTRTTRRPVAAWSD